MFIRLLIGRYAGEIRDVHEEEAHSLLARHMAEDPYAPQLADAVLSAAVQEKAKQRTEPQQSKPAKKRGRY